MTCYGFECSQCNGGKFIFKKYPSQDLLSNLNAVISTNEKSWILTGHVIFKLRYNQIYQLKTTHVIHNPAYTKYVVKFLNILLGFGWLYFSELFIIQLNAYSGLQTYYEPKDMYKR